jgi:hypothetical protein
MTEEASGLSADERHRMNFMGLVLFLRQMATQLVAENQLTEARGLVDSVESLQAKTAGNVGEEEAGLLESVLFELRMAVIAGPATPVDPGDTPSAEKAPSSSETEAPEGE